MQESAYRKDTLLSWSTWWISKAKVRKSNIFHKYTIIWIYSQSIYLDYPQSGQIPNRLNPRCNSSGKISLSPGTIGNVRTNRPTSRTNWQRLYPTKLLTLESSSVACKKKKDGSSRIWIDYRELDRHPLLRIDDLFDQLQWYRYHSKIELRSDIHQLRVQEEVTPNTTFKTWYGHYEFLVMPFGLTHAPTIFMDLMNQVCKPCLYKFEIVFINDIITDSQTKEFIVNLQRLKQIRIRN